MSRSRILVSLLVLLCIALGYAWLATPRQRRVADVTVKTSPLKGDFIQKAEALLDVEDLDFSAMLDTQYNEPKRDLFGPVFEPPKVVKPKPAPKPAAKKEVVVAKLQEIKPVVVEPPRVEPIPPLTVLGFLSKGAEYTVFLTSSQGEIYLVRDGERFADDLFVKDISAQGVTIARDKTGQQVTLKLAEKKSQRLPGLKLSSGRPDFTPPETADEPEKQAAGEGQKSPFMNNNRPIGEN